MTAFNEDFTWGSQLASEMVNLAHTFGNLAVDLHAAETTGLHAQTFAAQWGVVIDGNGSITGVNSTLGLDVAAALVEGMVNPLLSLS